MSTDKGRVALLKALEEREPDYNASIRMLRRPFSSPGYHTTIKQADYVHPTRETVQYAVALLDSGQETWRERAFSILEQIASLQDDDPASPTFGIWSWFYEEPLSQMAPPDWNWADFCGKQLVLADVRHGASFPPALRAAVKKAIYNSCEAIIKRNVGPEYTNIAIMGAFVTLIAGEHFREEKFRFYGFDRLERFYRHTKEQGTFQEYNSPTYTIVAIEELSSIATETENGEARAMIEELLDGAWEMAAYHFHPAVKQWAGPHSRSYDKLLPPEKLSFIQMACDGHLHLLPESELIYNLTWYGNRISCPAKYHPLYREVQERHGKQAVAKRADGSSSREAYLYMNPRVSVGSFSSNIMWNQCRNLLAYLSNGPACTYIHFRVLHDGYDYCSAVYNGIQEEGSVLLGVTFATNGGGTHPNLNPVHGRITASDLRLRFEIGGSLDQVAVDGQGDLVNVRVDGLHVKLGKLYGVFGGKTDFVWEIHKEEAQVSVDLVIHSGEARTLDFHSLSKACFLLAFDVAEADRVLQAETKEAGSSVETEVRFGENTVLSLQLPTAPDELHKLLHRS